MRKGLLVIQVVLAFFAVQMGVALASGTSDLGPGCGLGKVAWEGSKIDTNTWGPQLLISTTNNTILPWQAFGITTGIFGCKNNGKFWAEEKTNMFAAINFENISQEAWSQWNGTKLVRTSRADVDLDVPGDGERPSDLARRFDLGVNQLLLPVREQVMMIGGGRAAAQHQLRHAHQRRRVYRLLVNARPAWIKRGQPLE